MTLNYARITDRPVVLPSARVGARVSALVVVLLCACGGGGGGGELRTLKDTTVYPPVTITPAVRLNEARAGVPVQFDGGVCGGGNGQLTAQWTFGDGQVVINPTDKSHTYTFPGYYPLRVRCSDSSDGAGVSYATWSTSSAYIEVFP